MSMATWWAMGVRGRSTAEVLEAMRAWPPCAERLEACAATDTLGAFVEQKRAFPDWVFFETCETAGHALVSFIQQRHIPDLVAHVSRALATRVVSTDYDDALSFEHHAEVERGEVVIAYTSGADDATENGSFGFDPEELFAADYVFDELRRRAGVDLEACLFDDDAPTLGRAAYRIFAPGRTDNQPLRAAAAVSSCR